MHNDPHYKWITLSNTTLGVLMVTINPSILLIALPNIFGGIKLNPLLPSNVSYLLWLILGFLVVTAVLVVSLLTGSNCRPITRSSSSVEGNDLTLEQEKAKLALTAAEVWG